MNLGLGLIGPSQATKGIASEIHWLADDVSEKAPSFHDDALEIGMSAFQGEFETDLIEVRPILSKTDKTWNWYGIYAPTNFSKSKRSGHYYGIGFLSDHSWSGALVISTLLHLMRILKAVNIVDDKFNGSIEEVSADMFSFALDQIRNEEPLSDSLDFSVDSETGWRLRGTKESLAKAISSVGRGHGKTKEYRCVRLLFDEGISPAESSEFFVKPTPSKSEASKESEKRAEREKRTVRLSFAEEPYFPIQRQIVSKNRKMRIGEEGLQKEIAKLSEQIAFLSEVMKYRFGENFDEDGSTIRNSINSVPKWFFGFSVAGWILSIVLISSILR